MQYTKSCSLCGGMPYYEKDPCTGTYSWFHWCKGEDGKEHYYYCKGFKTQGDARRSWNSQAEKGDFEFQRELARKEKKGC